MFHIFVSQRDLAYRGEPGWATGQKDGLKVVCDPSLYNAKEFKSKAEADAFMNGLTGNYTVLSEAFDGDSNSTLNLEYFEVHDVMTVDGMGPSTTLGNFTTQAVAKEFARGRGNYGKDASVTKQRLVIWRTIDDKVQADKISKRNRALDKLTPEERELLGVK